MKNSPINYRHRLAKEWSLHGGVLIVGYEMFRKLHIDEKFSPILCQAPDLVIVDEAHRIGNPQVCNFSFKISIINFFYLLKTNFISQK